jgi:soluble lytic murein transglycosylase-like protein
MFAAPSTGRLPQDPGLAKPNALSVKLAMAFTLWAILMPEINRLHAPAVVLPVPALKLHLGRHHHSASYIYLEGQYDRLIEEAAARNDLDPLLIKAIISVESEFNPHCISPAGACGLMQLMPSTARLLGVKNIFDPKENIYAGAEHFKGLIKRFHSLKVTLAAYNAGELPVLRHHGIPPYRETRWYVYRVLRTYETYQIEAQIQNTHPAEKSA